MRTPSPIRRWKPTLDEPWNVARAVHLHRRAGFGSTWENIQRDLDDGPETAIGRVVSGRQVTKQAIESFEESSLAIGSSAMNSADPARLKAWWIYRILFTPYPLQEKLTLMWHNHFATSNLKVNDLVTMKRQNETLRRYATSEFGELLSAVLRDPAMLTWLDADSNHKGHPNENLARELMELFTLGIGAYTERDVKEVARSLTGLTTKSRKFHWDSSAHDAGSKTVLGKAGRWRSDDIVRILVEAPATSFRIAWRLCRVFMGRDAIDDDGIRELAKGLRAKSLNIGWAISTLLHSEAFLGDRNINSRVSDPIEFAAGLVTATEMTLHPPSTLLLGEWVGRLGQDLFYPPNVGGWSGGLEWLTTQRVIGRTNFASALTEGRVHVDAKPPSIAELVRRYEGKCTMEEGVTFLERLLLGRNLDSEAHHGIVRSLSKRSGTRDRKLDDAVILIMSQPRGQLV